MIYRGRRVLLAIHLVDDRPVVLCGTVLACEYDGQGLHRIELELIRTPNGEAIRRWAKAPASRPRPTRQRAA